MNILLALGGICFLWGVAALGFRTKNLPFLLKYAPAVLALVGAFLIWDYTANTLPVISRAEVSILNVTPQHLTMNVSVKKDRDCKFEDISVYVVTPDGISKEAQLTFLQDPTPNSSRPTGVSDLGKTLVVSYDNQSYSHLYFVTNHLCPFDIPIRSKFGDTIIPEVFNTVAPTVISTPTSSLKLDSSVSRLSKAHQ